MPLFTTTHQSYYQQTKSWTGDGTGGSGTVSFSVAALDFPTRPTQQTNITVYIDGIEISKSNYSYNGTDPNDTVVDNSYNLVFTSSGINTTVQETNGAPKDGLTILLKEENAAEQYGNYQTIGLTDLVNNFIISYVGEDRIIPKVKRTTVLFHAQRCVAELSYDTLRSQKSQEIELGGTLTMPLPHDYVNYVKLSWTSDDGVERLILPASKTSNPTAILQDDAADYLFDSDGSLLTTNESETWNKFKNASDNTGSTDNDSKVDDLDQQLSEGRRFGLDPQYATSNGLFYIDNNRGNVHFSSGLSGKIITLKYISDSLATEDEIKVHKFAEEAVYKWIAHAILATSANVQEYLVARFKKERFAAVRQAKLRLYNLKSEEIAQIMRGKSKQIKH